MLQHDYPIHIHHRRVDVAIRRLAHPATARTNRNNKIIISIKKVMTYDLL